MPACLPPPGPARDRFLAEEVLYLHSLWRQGPPPDPSPAVPPRGSGSLATFLRNKQRKLCNLELRDEPLDSDPDDPYTASSWPLAPSPPTSSSWPDNSAAPRPPPPLPVPSPASIAQRAALRAAEEFFSNSKNSSSETESEESEDEDGGEGEGDAALGFFLGLFERDAALRVYYEGSWEDGEFMCMACVGRGLRRGKARRFRGCVGLMHHMRASTRCGRLRAHRALTAAICRVLGWDMERLPSVVLDVRGPLGQSLAAVAPAHEAKEDVETRKKGSPGSGVVHEQETGQESAAKVFVGNSDSDACCPLGQALTGAAAAEETKEDGEAGKKDSSSHEDGREVHEQDIDKGSAEKYMERTFGNRGFALREGAMDIHLGENAIRNKEEHAKNAADNGDSDVARVVNNSLKG